MLQDVKRVEIRGLGSEACNVAFNSKGWEAIGHEKAARRTWQRMLPTRLHAEVIALHHARCLSGRKLSLIFVLARDEEHHTVNSATWICGEGRAAYLGNIVPPNGTCHENGEHRGA